MRGYVGNDLVKALQPRTRPYDVRDTKLNGFILRVHPTGRMVYYCEYTRGQKYKIGTTKELKPAEARQLADKTIFNFKNGIDPKVNTNKSNPTLREFLDTEKGDYGKYVQTNIKHWESTIKRIEFAFEHYLDDNLNTITAARLDKDWRPERQRGGAKVATINRDIVTIKSALSKATEWGIIQDNPLDNLKKEKTDQTGGKVRYLSREEETAIRKALTDRTEKMCQERDTSNQWRQERRYPLFPDLRKVRFVDHLEPMVLLSINTGIRRGELYKLTWENVDIPGRSISIVADTAKTGQTRHVPLNDEILSILKAWKKQKNKSSGLVFPSKDGKPFNDIKKAWKALLDLANIKSFRWHDMRHHFASVLVMSGVDLNTVRELLGHSDLKMTIRYAHLAPEHKAQAVNTLNKWANQAT